MTMVGYRLSRGEAIRQKGRKTSTFVKSYGGAHPGAKSVKAESRSPMLKVPEKFRPFESSDENEYPLTKPPKSAEQGAGKKMKGK